MCRRTVRKGLALLVAGVLSVTVATFFHDQVGRLLFFWDDAAARITYYGLTLGAASGACGVLVAIGGALRAAPHDRSVRLMPVILLLLFSVAFFLFLSYLSVTGALTPPPGPGESINI